MSDPSTFDLHRAQCRQQEAEEDWEKGMMARYDRESDRRRDKVGSVLAELVDKAKS
ncbi:MAG: hypothetical protein JRG89_07725 [Deltaproteobacteria bacterium]|nr:hypothetical protein [Deltaproteobacteria bacterium]MBW2388313.1 hypothetical protein [Deltaproteobacteria bacterium]